MPGHSTHPPLVGKTTSYRRIGYCIYCGSTKPPLSREHVIPRGISRKFKVLGAHGAAVLGSASCEECRRITHHVETQCQQRMLGHLRGRLGIAQSARPNAMDGVLRLPDGSIKPVTGHPDDFAAGLLLPMFNQHPRLWLPENAQHQPIVRWVYKEVLAPRDPSPFVGLEVGLEFEFDAEIYQRMLAKIALGEAILKLGYEYFHPLVNDFIRGLEPDGMGKYIFGFSPEQELPPDYNDRIYHFARIRDHVHNETTFVLCFINLFANYGGPTNAVVVGIKNDAPAAA